MPRARRRRRSSTSPTDPSQQPQRELHVHRRRRRRRRSTSSSSSAASTAPTSWPGRTASTRRSTSTSARASTRFEVRARRPGEAADPTPAQLQWTYVPLPSGVAPDTTIDLAPPAETSLLDAIFTFPSNEPDVTFECQRRREPWSRAPTTRRCAGRVSSTSTSSRRRGRPAHVPGARHRLRGQRRPDAGRPHLDDPRPGHDDPRPGPAYEPGDERRARHRRRDRETSDGDDRLRRQRRRRDVRVLARPRAVRAVRRRR